jgi:hypothetical protein
VVVRTFLSDLQSHTNSLPDRSIPAV